MIVPCTPLDTNSSHFSPNCQEATTVQWPGIWALWVKREVILLGPVPQPFLSPPPHIWGSYKGPWGPRNAEDVAPHPAVGLQQVLSRWLWSEWGGTYRSRQVGLDPALATHPYSHPQKPFHIKLTFWDPFVMSLHSLEAQYDNHFCDFSIINSDVKTEQNLRSQIQAPLYRWRTEAWGLPWWSSG